MAGDSLRVAQVYTEFETRGLGETEKGIRALKNTLGGVRTLLAGIVGGIALKSVAKSFVVAAARAEDYRTSIRAVSSSIEEADATFQRVKNWAAVNPINTDEAIGAFVRLRTAAVQNSEEALRAIADVATAMHRDMREVAAAVVTTEVEPLRNLGIMLDRTGKKAVLSSNGIRLEVSKDINSIRAGIIELMTKSMGGAMDKAKTTWSGALATMGGMWANFKTDIMGEGKDSGPFQKIKDQINAINSEWEKFTKSDSYKELIENIQSGIVYGIELAVDGVKKLGEAFRFVSTHKDALVALASGLAAYKVSILAVSSAQLIFKSGFVSWLSLLPSAITSISGVVSWLGLLGTTMSFALPIALLVGGVAWLTLKDKQEKARIEMESTKTAMERLNKAVASSSTEHLQQEAKDAKKELEKLTEEIFRAMKAMSSASLVSVWDKFTNKGGEQTWWQKLLSHQSPEMERFLKRREEERKKIKYTPTGLKTVRGSDGKYYSDVSNIKSPEEFKKLLLSGKITVEGGDKIIAQVKYIEGLEKEIKSRGKTPTPPPDSGTDADKSSGKSAAEKLVESIRDQIKYLNADGESFLPVLDAWLSKTKVLSDDWKALKDLYNEITDAAEANNPFAPDKVLERLKETKERMASLREESERLKQAFYDTFSWQHDMGLISDAEHVEKLRENFERLKEEYISTGAAIENYQLWPQELKDAYSALHHGIASEAQPAIEMLNKRFQEGVLTFGEYREALNALLVQYGATPLLAKQIAEQIKAAESSTLSFRDSIRAMLTDAQKSFEGLASAVIGGVVDSFARAIAYSENLGDALKKLGQDIVYTVTKMLLLQQISSWFGVGGGSGSTASLYPNSGMWIGAIRGQGFGFHSGGVVGSGGTPVTILPKYHAGGVVGGNWRIKPDEEVALLRKNEVVLTEADADRLRAGGVLGPEGEVKGDSVADRLKAAFAKLVFPEGLPKYHAGGVVGGIATPLRADLAALSGVSASRAGDVSFGNTVFAPSIIVHVTNNNSGGGEMSDKQAQQLGEGVRDMVDARFMENMYQFQRSGAYRSRW
ncbi:MAG: hypothetical protein SOR75_11195 [Synergistes jonesii]|uniref:hypothetical protein n=1 Tax=Synergistes jonesii TaxID=2754 RepID=UPI002A7541BD|nr:hypothetical protein [Synergistes jonesii]MDY2985875.1 hypothetical protein [Synergistes jonesii]